MKPEKLILSGWGPYKERVEIDFTKLNDRGLFLIAGPTGAGKTTIFDAITYALYGSMSGETREKNSVRSDFASEDVATFVELVMQHGGKEYRMVRNPEYLRPRKKKGGKGAYAREKENAVLYLPDGGIVEGSSEVNRRLQEILVLDYRQFKQISMIAQGEFAKLLTAAPGEKTKIFRELFATSVYDRFAGILKNRAAELYRQVMECRSRMEEDTHILRWKEEEDMELAGLIESDNPPYDKIIAGLKELARACKGRLTEEEKNYAAFEKKTAVLAGKIELAEQINGKLRKLKELLLQQKELSGREKEIGLTEKRLRWARRAAGLTEDYVRAGHAGEIQAAMKEKVLEAEKELEACIAREAEWAPVCKEKEAIRAAYEVAAACEEEQGQLQEACKQLAKKEKELLAIQKKYLEQEEIAAARKRELEAADQAYRRAVVGIVARQLEDGRPCPVCGSLDHPKIAEAAREVPDEKGLQALNKRYEKEQGRLMELHGQAAACQGEAAACRDRKEELARRAEEYVERREGFSGKIKKVLETMSREEYEKTVSRHEAVKVQIQEKRNRLEQEKRELAEQEAARLRLEEAFQDKCREAGFGSVKEFGEAILSQEEMEKLEEEIKAFHRKKEAVGELIAHLRQETEGQEERDAGALKGELAKLNEEKQQMFRSLQEKNHRLLEIRKITASLKEKEKRLAGLVREYGIVKDLDNMASGNNAKRLVFEQYVLAGYFEEILEAANLRLARMTGGRYELSRLEGISDGRIKDNLEMRILDNYTGKYRSVRTLSGGESFKASLSLALGMSDVIQGYSGGVRVDTLFIDEGFGALDSESLEQACQTLMSLVEKDRLIGIISHVPELAEKIEKQIVVTKTNVGSRVEIVG